MPRRNPAPRGPILEIAVIRAAAGGHPCAETLPGIVAVLTPDGAPTWGVCGDPNDWSPEQRAGLRDHLLRALQLLET